MSRHAVLLVGILMVAACTGGRAPTPSPSSAALAVPTAAPATADSSPSPSATPEPSATAEPLPADLPDDIREAIAWRLDKGLRADPDWVIAVHADPTAVHHWAYPILPEEEDFIWDRQAHLDTFIEPIQRYAHEHRDVFGGLYLDNRNSRIMTLWTEDPEGHLAEMLADAGPGAPIAATLVRWSERELRDVQDVLAHDHDWFGDYLAAAEGFGADITDNVVDIEISSANPDAPRLIAERLARRAGFPVEMLRVTSDGTGLALLPWGQVRGIVTMADGSPVRFGDLILDWAPHGVGSCGGGDIGYGVDRHGEFRLPCRVGAYTIEVKAPDDGEGWVVVGRAEATVREDETTRIRVRLDEDAPAP